MIEPLPVSETAVKKGLWTKEQVKLAFHLYCQLPFGKLDQKTAEEIVAKAHAVCPYSNAVKGNIDVAITVTVN